MKFSRLIEYVKFIIKAILRSFTFAQKRYPLQIQLPITSQCNSKCQICSVWKMNDGTRLECKDLARYLQDPIFKKVRGVGINGGEPSLVKNLPELMLEILNLPRLISVNIISNGLITDPFLQSLETIYDLCKEKGIQFSIIISLDGVGPINDFIRGVDGAYDKTMKTILRLKEERTRYCDRFSVGCTVTKYNVFNLAELNGVLAANEIPVSYWLGVDNLRTATEDCNQFNVLADEECRQAAMEFFYGKYCSTKNLKARFGYFARFYYLEQRGKKRLAYCSWRDRDITLDQEGNVYYCATKSKCIGNLNSNKGKNIFFSKEHLLYRKQLCQKECSSCIHYCFSPNLIGCYKMIENIVFKNICFKVYRKRKH